MAMTKQQALCNLDELVREVSHEVGAEELEVWGQGFEAGLALGRRVPTLEQTTLKRAVRELVSDYQYDD